MTKITAADIRLLLQERYSDSRRFAYAEEVANATGLESRRRLDMVIVDCYKSNGYAIEGIEVKVSKSDLRRELEDSSKHNIFYDHIDYYSLCAPETIVDMKLIPEKWGVYLIHEEPDGSLKLKVKRKPLSLHDEMVKSVDKAFIASLFRSMWSSKPSDVQIGAAYKKGYEAALSDAGVKDYQIVIDHLKEKLNAFLELERRLGIWGTGDIERGIKEYEAFKKLNLRNLTFTLERITRNIKDIDEVLKQLKGECQ